MDLPEGVLRPPTFLTETLSPVFEQGCSNAISLVPQDGSAATPTPASPDPSRPSVTLTFAQSLDAKIAGQRGAQLALSGKESLVMTHWMRTMHDGIMVGINTVLNDNPQLNTRHLPPLPANSSQRYHLPRPIILDTNLRFPVDCKLLKNYNDGRGRRPWVLTSSPLSDPELSAWRSKVSALEAAGARVIDVPTHNGCIRIPEMLCTLREQGIRSLMVEGGATVIRSFLSVVGPSAPANGAHVAGLVDTVIVTVAPVFVGADGVGYGEDLQASQVSRLQHVQTELFGRDAVMALKLPVSVSRQ